LFTKVMKYAFFGELCQRWQGVKEVPRFMQVSMIVLALISLVSGLLLMPRVSEVFLRQATRVFIEGTNYAAVILGDI